MTSQMFPVGGWEARPVAIPRPLGKPALLRLRSRGPLTSYFATPWIDTAQERSSGAALFQTWGRSWHPFVLPGRYTHLEVCKMRGNGVARWQLDRLLPEEVPPLPTTVEGHGTQLFGWEGEQVEMRYEYAGRSGGLRFTHHAFGTGESLEVDRTGTQRGTVRVSGPGYLWVYSAPASDWTLKAV
ncbi:hypothetical protein ACWGH3_03705 [Streptomyces sp. NPDC054884]|uniref:hypothetical protein n=1 Tax=Streptomyces sp. ME08-AFT2 TaxID=3028683 RepID=UPI0029B91F58|nr:hypothetical protein [Streptomyces sp. ME08-AFT2]MDX3307960.1 hypothetical protein [Streptomyces sp. ME08-AFT2]